jgi:hypothetical protein
LLKEFFEGSRALFDLAEVIFNKRRFLEEQAAVTRSSQGSLS